MSEPRYTFEHGSYYFMGGDRVVLMADQVAIGFSREDDGLTIVHKHGSPNQIQAWLAEAKRRLIEGGDPKLAESFCMVTFPRAYDVEKINRCLSTTGYLGSLLEVEAGELSGAD